jgi:hypothetical protein
VIVQFEFQDVEKHEKSFLCRVEIDLRFKKA